MPIPTPRFEKREDGKCCRCERSPAETRDELFCLTCLYEQIAHDNPIPGQDPDEFDDADFIQVSCRG